MHPRLVAVLLIAYVAIATWMGLLSADPDVIDAFAGARLMVLVALLAIMYAVISLLTVWLISFLTRFLFKVTSPQADQGVFAAVARGWAVLALLCRVPALLTRQFADSPIGAITLIIPIIVAGLWIRRHGARTSAWVSLLPLLAAIGIDLVLLVGQP